MIKRKLFPVLSFFILFPQLCQAISTAERFKPVTDSLSILFEKRNSVINELKVKKVLKRGNFIDFYFDTTLGEYPWRTEDINWFRETLNSLLPEEYNGLETGYIFSKNIRIEDLATPELRNDGTPSVYRYSYEDRDLGNFFVEREGSMRFQKGLSGRNIALWQSHGRYFDAKSGEWIWQRPPLFTTVEDMFTQSFVLPFLIPMLENAGAYVMTPRERDTQRLEIIIDNDPSFEGERVLPMRQVGIYNEKEPWENAGVGFADTKAVWMIEDNPFIQGTARKTACRQEADNEASWSFKVREKGSYAVYVSYKSFPNSSRNAHYTVSHRAGKSSFIVNQRMGGGTWVYLGTFEFDGEGSVVLDNGTSSGRVFEEGSIVSADAVKIGGGMGKVARGRENDEQSEYSISGLPSYAEGALYSLLWAGTDTTVTGQWEGDYNRDYASRGAWVSMLSGGSERNPKQEGKNIPIDLSLGFHSDAGLTPNDSTVGTLAIYTLMCENSDKLPDGKNRAVGRHYADLVQSQVVGDIRSQFDSTWRRRCLWNRSYSECRTTSVPGMLLELLSHQNFADMRYGLDPSFRFTVSRAVYKGILKFLSDLYQIPYIVQPLPVRAMAVRFGRSPDTAEISWESTVDSLEPTAEARSFILYTRIDDKAFDAGKVISDLKKDGNRYSTQVPIVPGHIYSFKMEALNEGGKSFPSEILCLGTASRDATDRIAVVNNFDRVSGPTWFDTPAYAGFDSDIDAGVPYQFEINYIGKDYEHRRDMEFVSNSAPGFGASRLSMATSKIAGNTFDYPYIHGKALLECGYAFFSTSRDAWTERPDITDGSFAVDLICGKQVTTKMGNGNVADRYEVFPDGLQECIKAYSKGGGNLIVSGADIATDVWDRVYPIVMDSLHKAKTQAFVRQVLGYELECAFASETGHVVTIKNASADFRRKVGEMSFRTDFNGNMYRVENPDGLKPYGKRSVVFLKYKDTDIPAAVWYNAENYRIASFGFPLETIENRDELRKLLKNTLQNFKK